MSVRDRIEAARRDVMRASELDGTYADMRPVVVQLINAVYELVCCLQECEERRERGER